MADEFTAVGTVLQVDGTKSGWEIQFTRTTAYNITECQRNIRERKLQRLAHFYLVSVSALALHC